MSRLRTWVFIVVMGLAPVIAFADQLRTPALPAPRLRQSAVYWLDKVVGDKILPAGVGRGNPIVYGGRAFGIMITIVSIVFLVRTIQAGITWMMAQGDSEKIETARRILTQSLIGLAVMFSIYASVTVVLRFLRTSIRGPGETIQYTQTEFREGEGFWDEAGDFGETGTGWSVYWNIFKGPFCRNIGDGICEE